MAHAGSVYRLLLKLYPARFREEYGAPLEQAFRDEYGDADGRWARARLWGRLIADLLVSVPRELAHELGDDVRYGIRVYAKRPMVTLLALSALTLAIGATTGVFSVVNALLLRSLPFHEPERLVQLEPSHGMDTSAGFHAWRKGRPFLADAVEYDRAEMTISRGDRSIRAAVCETSSNFFSTLGASPVAGRGFMDGEDVPGKDAVAVIGYGLWQQMYGGDPRALGSSILLNGQPTTVVGVAPPSFDFPRQTAVWTPAAFDFKRLPKTGVIYAETVGRLKAGIRLSQANAAFATEVRREDPERPKDQPLGLTPLRDQLAGPVRDASLVLMGAVLFVLLVACANVAHLLLTRVTERHKELVVRAALGASRARLIQQLLTESIVVALVAAVAGLLVAEWASHLAASAQPAQLAVQQYRVLDWRVLAFAIGVAVLTGIVFGVLPSVVAGRLQPASVVVRNLAGRGAGTGRLRRALIAGQVALTLILLAGSVSMGRAFLGLVNTDLGLRTEHVVTASVSVAGTRHEMEDRRRAYVEQALTRLRTTPGVLSAGGVDFLPLGNEVYWGGSFTTEGKRTVPFTTVVTVTSDYFRAIGTDILHGRDFTASDTKDAPPVAIVNEAFVRAAGEGEHLLGHTIRFGRRDDRYAVVGITRSVRYRGPSQPRALPQVFLSQAQQPAARFTTFVIRVSGPADRFVPVAREVLQGLDRQVPPFNVQTLDARLGQTMAKTRFYTYAVIFLGGFALLLSIVGIYGAASYSVAQRSGEVGVRLALGATSGEVRRMFMKQSAAPVAVGMVAGVAGAVALGRLVEHLVAAAHGAGLWTCAGAGALLAITAASAVWTATQAVLRLQPLDVLRAE